MRLDDPRHTSEVFLQMLLGVVSVKRRLDTVLHGERDHIAQPAPDRLRSDGCVWATLGVVALWQAASRTLAEFGRGSMVQGSVAPSAPPLEARHILR